MSKLFFAIGIFICATVIICGLLLARNRSTTRTDNPGCSITYLPLGDSYSIGESVAVHDRWPNQLTNDFKTDSCSLQIIDNPARTGFTSQDLIDTELPLVAKNRPDFVTIQIGVNDFVQGVQLTVFEDNLRKIITTTQSNITNRKNILLVTIPDFSKTPTGSQFGSSSSLTNGVVAFNEVITRLGTEHSIPVADIFTISQKVELDESLTANDGLHPSGTQYTLWTREIVSVLMENDLPER